jgi:hypothetical protein
LNTAFKTPFLSSALSMRFLQSPQLASTANVMVTFLSGFGATCREVAGTVASAVLANWYCLFIDQ